MTPVQAAWLLVILTCCLYLGVRRYAELTDSDLGLLLLRWWALPAVIAFALLLAVLDSLGVRYR